MEKIDGLWECKLCGKTFVKKDRAQSRTETHNPQYHECTICSKTLRSRDSLRTHVRNAHSDATFICNVCGKSGMSKMRFKSHKYQSKCAARFNS